VVIVVCFFLLSSRIVSTYSFFFLHFLSSSRFSFIRFFFFFFCVYCFFFRFFLLFISLFVCVVFVFVFITVFSNRVTFFFYRIARDRDRSVPLVGGVAQEGAAIAKDDGRSGSRCTGGVRSTDGGADDPLDTLGLTDVTGKDDVEGAEGKCCAGLSRPGGCLGAVDSRSRERHGRGVNRRSALACVRWGYRGFFEFYGEWRPIATLDGRRCRRSARPAASRYRIPGFVFIRHRERVAI